MGCVATSGRSSSTASRAVARVQLSASGVPSRCTSR